MESHRRGALITSYLAPYYAAREVVVVVEASHSKGPATASAGMRAPKAPLTAPAGIWKKWPSVDSSVADNDKQGRPSTAQPLVLFSL